MLHLDPQPLPKNLLQPRHPLLRRPVLVPNIITISPAPRPFPGRGAACCAPTTTHVSAFASSVFFCRSTFNRRQRNHPPAMPRQLLQRHRSPIVFPSFSFFPHFRRPP